MTPPAAKKSPKKKIAKGLHDNPKQNRILAALPAADYERLLPDPWNILAYSLDKTNFAYFKTSEPQGLVELLLGSRAGLAGWAARRATK